MWRGGRLPLEGAPLSQADSEGGSTSGEEVEVGKPPATLPRYYPLSPSFSSSGSKERAPLKVSLARLNLESTACTACDYLSLRELMLLEDF